MAVGCQEGTTPALLHSGAMPYPSSPSVTVVIPVHNESDYLPKAHPQLFAEMESVNAAVRVVIAENGSTDNTADLVRDAMETYASLSLLELPTPDYGAAMREGFMQASTDWVANFDIDYFSGTFLNHALDLADSADIVLASKRVEGADDQRGNTRIFATWTFNQLLRLVLSSGVSDTHGMKLVRKTVVETVAPDVISTTDLFDTELVVRAERAGFRIAELPASVVELRDTKSSLVKRVPRTLKGVWSIRKDLKSG
jgi:glycosyltransferase involved in cell wall biosynthesis